MKYELYIDDDSGSLVPADEEGFETWLELGLHVFFEDVYEDRDVKVEKIVLKISAL